MQGYKPYFFVTNFETKFATNFETYYLINY